MHTGCNLDTPGLTDGFRPWGSGNDPSTIQNYQNVNCLSSFSHSNNPPCRPTGQRPLGAIAAPWRGRRWLCRKPPTNQSLVLRLGQRRKQLAQQLGSLLGELRLKGFSNRDCKASNIMVADVSGLGYKLYLVDLDGLRLRRFRLGHRILRG